MANDNKAVQTDKSAQPEKAKNDKAKNDKTYKRSRVKETFGELKKVTWPTFGKTMKQTGAVFVVTIFFLVILLVMDQLLGLAHSKLSDGLKPPADEMVRAFQAAFAGLKNAASAFMAKANTFVPLM